MEVTQRELVTMIHGMLFGGFFLLALFGMLILLLERSSPDRIEADVNTAQPTHRWQTLYFFLLIATGWAAVLSGAYILYPWYRAVAPAGADLALYPKFLLTAHPYTAGWHNFGMEWKEHIAWFTPIVMTMVAYVFLKYGPQLALHRHLRNAVLGFTAVAFFATAVSGGIGAFLNKVAPVRGGADIVLLKVE